MSLESLWRVSCQNMKIIVVIAALLGALISGCSNSDEFKNLSEADSHAVIKGIGDVSIGSVNGLPTSFWRLSEEFLIPDGEAVITPSFSSHHHTCGYMTMEFKAVEDHTYEVSRKLVQKEAGEITATPHPSTPKGWIIHDPRDLVKLVGVTNPKAHELILISQREEYVFGEKSADLAVRRYREMYP